MGYFPRILALLFAILAGSTARASENGEWAATIYGAEMSSEDGWEDLFINPIGADYIGTYLVAGALSRQYASFHNDALALEAEGQVVRYFGDQDHWEFNAVPIVARWKKFPWSNRLDFSTAFGIGLSYASELPPVEVQLEGESHRTLVYWVVDVTAGPLNSPWSASLRLHHRSVAYGLMGEEGGMNALGLGVRYEF